MVANMMGVVVCPFFGFFFFFFFLFVFVSKFALEGGNEPHVICTP